MGRKKLKTGKITAGKSYVPAGLTADQYNKLRKAEDKKKADNYQRNVKKAGIFVDYTEFYLARGTDSGESWAKSVTGGHTMAKTKYHWSGSEDNPQHQDLLLKKRLLLRKRTGLVNKFFYQRTVFFSLIYCLETLSLVLLSRHVFGKVDFKII